MKGLNKKQNPIINAIAALREAMYYEHLEHSGHHVTEGGSEDCSVCSRLDRCLEDIEEMQIETAMEGLQSEPPQEIKGRSYLGHNEERRKLMFSKSNTKSMPQETIPRTMEHFNLEIKKLKTSIKLFHSTLDGMYKICDRSGKDSEGSRAIGAAKGLYEVIFKEGLK